LKEKSVDFVRENVSISTDKSKLDVEYVHRFLRESYWAQDIPLEVVAKSIEGSICFGMYYASRQIGFARVITDSATFAYLADVFIDEDFRGNGLAKWLVEEIMGYPELDGLRRFMLATRDAHGLYQKFGFSPLSSPERWMQIHNPDIYKKR
jgi:GNAT superfamily N-acetyltransferase